MTMFNLKEKYTGGTPPVDVKLFFVAENPLDYEYYTVVVETHYDDETIETEHQFSTFKEANSFFEEMTDNFFGK